MIRILAVTIGLVGLIAPGRAQTCDPDGLIQDQAVFRVAPGRSLSEALAAMEAALPGLTVAPVDAIPGRPIHLVAFTLPDGATPADLELNLFNPAGGQSLIGDGSDPARPLSWGELEYAAETAESKTGSGYVSGPALNMAAFADQYATNTLGVSTAHARAQGAGVAVAVLDTGIAVDHPALAGARVLAGFNFVTETTSTSDLGDGADNDGDGQTDEGVGHGTFVASLIHRVAPDAALLPVVVLDSEGRTGNFRIAKGVFYAVDRGVEVINMSFGSTYNSEAVEDALDEAELLGIVAVAAAGNCQTSEREFPASRRGVVGVVSVDIDDRKSDFSNYNDRMTISAPGGSETDAGDPTGYDPAAAILGALPDGSFGVWEGTSLAAPWVAGTAALIRGQHPEWAPSEPTADRVVARLEDTAVNIYAQNPAHADDEELGAGRLDIAAVVAAGPPQPIRGDLDRDGNITLTDLALLLKDYGLVHSSADLDNNGRVDISDLAILLSAF